MSYDDFQLLSSKFREGEFMFLVPENNVTVIDKLKFIAVCSVLPVSISAFWFLGWYFNVTDENFHKKTPVVIATCVLVQIIIVCIAFSTKVYGIDLQLMRPFVRQKCFGKTLWLRSFKISAGASVGVGVLGLRNQFEHTIYFLTGRRRWKFLMVQFREKTPQSEFIVFCSLLSSLLKISSNGYSLPFRFYLY